MKPIIFNEFIVFTKARAEGYQKCIYCKEHIGRGNVGLSMIKKCAGNYNVWLHINCIDKFCDDIKKFRDEHIKEILVEKLLK